jgi:hypothetical protein
MIAPEIIESELKAFKSEINLYKTIPYYDRSERLKENISNIIENNMFNIFSNKKVK